MQGSELEERAFVRVARILRKASRQFGWPMLIFLLLGPGAVTTPHPEMFGLYLSIGSLPILGGLFLRVWARGYLREDGFVVDGPYRYVRNPVELGAISIYTGAGIVLGLAMWYLISVIFVAFTFLSITASVYEGELQVKYGGPYLRYCRRVRRWIPSRLPGTNRSARTFSVLHALKQERESLLWLTLYLIAFAARQNWLHRV